MPRTAGIAACMLFAAVAPAFAQAAPENQNEFELGRAALAQDPARAITHFERVDTRDGREWLAIALMMESRSPSDSFVERAFAAAARSRITQPDRYRTRDQIAATLRPGDLVVALLVGEAAAYAWAFDRDKFVGYQLPPHGEIAAAVDRARAYVDRGDRDGEKRIADDLVPALLGPAMDRLPNLRRVLLVMDGPLRELPAEILSVNDPGPAIEATDYDALADAIARPAPERSRFTTGIAIATAAIAIAAIFAWVVSRRARHRSRARS